jgi:hypothetical protein
MLFKISSIPLLQEYLIDTIAIRAIVAEASINDHERCNKA